MNRSSCGRVVAKTPPDAGGTQRYLEQAARLRQAAGRAQMPEVRNSLLALAHGYERIAAYRSRRLLR